MCAMIFLFPIEACRIELVRPLEERQSRVHMLKFSGEGQASRWLAEKSREEAPIFRLPPAASRMRIDLPAVRHSVKWLGRRILAGPRNIRAEGITKRIDEMFGRDTVRFWAEKHANLAKKSKRTMQSIGTQVDMELKKFAKGQAPFRLLKHKESQAIVMKLAQENISLINSGILVSNISAASDSKRCSGTEIDLVGFDHERRCHVIIEVKVTKADLHSLEESNRKASIDKHTGFRQSLLGKFAAQLACTSLMFRQTYSPCKTRALIVVCQADTCSCATFQVSDNLIQPEKFVGWLPGF